MRHIALLLIITILAFQTQVSAQINKRGGDLYSITYTNDDYKTGSDQNFSVVKDQRGIMYFANAGGVLTFDGANWKTIKIISNLAAKALAIDTITNTFYVGANGNFGRLVTNEAGSYEYETLLDRIPEDSAKFSSFRNIVIDPNEGVIFTTPSAIYILKKDDTFNVIFAEGINGFTPAYQVDGHVYVAHSEKGIMEIKNGELVELPQFKEAGSATPLIDKTQDRIVIGNVERGLFFYENDSLYKPDLPIQSGIIQDLYCFKKTNDGQYYLLGTKRHGLIVTDRDFNIVLQTLTDVFITSIFEDENQMLWITTNDKGIIVFDLFSPFTRFTKNNTGITGFTRTITLLKDEIYIGVDAVFHIKRDSLHTMHFKEITNPKGDNTIWKLDTIQGHVLVCGAQGMSDIDTNNELHNLDGLKVREIRNFVIPSNNPNVIIGCAPNGFSIYKKEKDIWQYHGSAANFNDNVRSILEDTDGTIVASQKSSGVFRIKFNESFDSVLSYKKYNAEEGGLPSNIENYIFDTGNGLTVGTLDGFYKYNPDSDKYMPDTKLNTAFGGKNVYNMMYNDHVGSLWVKHVVYDKRSKSNNWLLERYTMLGDSSARKTDKIFRPYMGRIQSFGYVGDGCYIIGDKDAFVLYDDKIEKKVDYSYNAIISTIENIYNDSIIYGGFDPGKEILLPYSQRSIRVFFAATCYEYPKDIKFKSFLEGNDEEWSDFRSETYKEYTTLSPGKYTLHVKALNIYNVESEEATITFQIFPPWYLTIWAKNIYAALFGFLIWAFVKAYTKKLIRDKEKLEKIVEERTAEIRQQSQLILEKNEEITAKNKEITDSIKYAQRIQTAMLPIKEKIQMAIPNHFILFRPKDIVSGDYYWYAETEQSVVITAADCTGHGVPGAFMSMIGSQILTEIVSDGITSPDEILTNQNRRIRKALKQDTTENQDGMDMALCRIDKKTHIVEYAGAKNQLIVIQNGELTEYKADKQSIGGQQLYGDDFQFKKITIKPDGNTWFYMFSDGYKDQFGGKGNTKFLIKNLRALLLKIHTETPERQREILNETIEKWIKDGDTEQTDDIILIGFKC